MYPIRSAYPQQNLYTQVRASLLASGPGQPRILRGRGRGRQRRPRGMERLGWDEQWDQRGDIAGDGGCSPEITPLGVGAVPPKSHAWLLGLKPGSVS